PVAIAVEIDDGNVVGSGDRVPGNGEPPPQGVFRGRAAVPVPVDVPMKILDDHHIHFAVAIDVANHVALQPGGRKPAVVNRVALDALRDSVSRDVAENAKPVAVLDQVWLKPAVPRVLEPVEFEVAGVGTGKVQITVAIEIG